MKIFEIYLKYISSISYQKYIIIFFEGEEIKYIYSIYVNIFKYIFQKYIFPIDWLLVCICILGSRLKAMTLTRHISLFSVEFSSV